MYLIFDTETTGLPKNFDAPHTDLENWPRLVQIAWQLHDSKGKLLSADNLIVKPDGFTIPFNAEKVHGISTEIAEKEGHPLREVLQKFAQDIEKADVLIGHNIEFDLNIMGAEFIRGDIKSQLWKTETICTKLTTVEFVGIPGGKGGGYKWATLTELHHKLFGKGFDDAHDAAYDVDATARCFFGLLVEKVVPTKDGRDPSEITYEPPKLDEANFQRKKGEKGTQIPEQFRRKHDPEEVFPFSHLHLHSQFSILQSTANIKQIVAKAKANNMEAVAITDHGNLHAAFNAVSEGAKNDVKIIIGCEFHVAEERTRTKFTKNDRDRRFSQVLLATNQEAYHRLSELCSRGFTEGFYFGVPRIGKDLIEKYHEGLIALTGGYFNFTDDFYGEIPYLILNRGEHEAEEAFKWWHGLFGDNFYVEIMRHGLEEEDRINQILLKFADKYNVKIVATNNVYYIDKNDADAHDTLLCVKGGKTKSTSVGWGRKNRFAFPNQNYYMTTPEEMNQLFYDIPSALENTKEIVDKCSPLKLKRDILMPRYEMPPEFVTQDDYLKYLTYEGAKTRYPKMTDEIQERLDRELKIIQNMGFPGYFLIVQDFINKAKNMGVAVGPGRGCLSGNSRIILANGTSKLISEIQINDAVITQDGSIQKVQNTFKYEIEEDLVKIISYYGENTGITLTKDHKILAQKQTYPSNYKNWAESTQKAPKKPNLTEKLTWVSAGELEVGDWVFIPKPQLSRINQKITDLAQYSNKENLFHDDNFVYHDVLNPLCSTIQKQRKAKRYITWNENWYFILGLFVGDGWIQKDKRPTVSFAFYQEDTETIQIVKDIFEAQEMEVSIGKPRRGRIQFHVNNKHLYLLFRNLFEDYQFTSDTKYLPDFVLHSSEKYITSFLRGYCHVDGQESTHKYRLTTTSRKLADQIRFLCWQISLPASISKHIRTIEKRPEFQNAKPSYVINIPKDKRIGNSSAQKKYIFREIEGGMITKIREVKTVQNERFVYDFEVEKHHNYLTSSFLVHNSAAGSAVAFCTGITNIDPIKYNLLFERFLNPERVSMPDIDIDFDDAMRQDAIDYVIKKYGQNQVAQIITYGTMAAKMSIKDVARVLQLPLDESNMLAKLVPEKPGTKLKKAFEEVDELKNIFAKNPERDAQAKVLHNAKVLEGSVRGTGIHAAGVIIAPDDLMKYIPVCTSKDADLWVTQFDGRVVEDAGMLKMDFLGLKTLTIIKDAIKLIEKNHGIKIDPDEIPLNDKAAFELYQRGETVGTFQFESDGMRKYLRELKPTDIEDLIAMNALYRPGPLQYIPTYINRKHGKEKVEYPHELLRPILEPTYGIMIYQEQIMQTAQILAGYSLGGADLLRRAMGKKKMSEMQKQRGIFVKGAKKLHDIPKAKAEEIFDVMEGFAAYGFNRSHSAAYSVVAYQTAYLKANYTAEYMASVMTHSMGNIDKISFFMEECKNIGVNVLGPDVNESSKFFDVNQQKEIRFGLGAIKGAGDAAVESIIDERTKNSHFEDIHDFTERINLRTVNKKTFESLAYAGAFDCFSDIHRAQYFHKVEGEHTTGIEKLIKYGNYAQEEKKSSQVALFGGAGSTVEMPKPKLSECDPWSEPEKLAFEREVVGFFITGHPLDQYRDEIEAFCTCLLSEVEQYKNKEIKVGGILSQMTEKQTKNGKPFALFTIEDYDSSLSLAMFGEDYLKAKHLFDVNSYLFIKGKVQPRYNQENVWELRPKTIELLSEVREKYAKELQVFLSLEKLDNKMLSDLQFMIQQNKGNSPLKMYLFDPDAQKTVRTTSKLKVDLSGDLTTQLRRSGLKYKIG